MENATKALIIAAGVLIGIMILSIGTYLYYSLGTYVDQTKQEIEQNAISRFNTQFLNYKNIEVDKNGKEYASFQLTIQDIITVANMAYENNKSYNMTKEDANDTTLYVKVNAKFDNSERTTYNLEEKVADNSAMWLSIYNNNQYKCRASDIKVSTVTGRVYEINFDLAIE